jgi:hypothetical protein
MKSLEQGPSNNNLESLEQQPKTTERLSNNESLLYQTYATEIEGKDFNEQASPEAYEEAEKLLRQFQDPKFDWLGVDWNKIDFKNLKDIKDVEKRVRLAAQFLLNEAKYTNPDLFEKLVNMLGGEEKTADKIIGTAGFASLSFMVLSFFSSPLVGPDLAGVGSAIGLLGPLALDNPDLKIGIRSFIRKHMGKSKTHDQTQLVKVLQRDESVNIESSNKEKLTEVKKRQIIEESNSFSDLYQNIKRIGGVPGSKRVYDSEHLISIIDRVRSGVRTINYVTQTYGVRDAVERLLKIKGEPLTNIEVKEPQNEEDIRKFAHYDAGPRKEKLLVDYLSYQDAELSPEQKERTIEANRQSKSALLYANSLGALETKHSLQEIESKAVSMIEECSDILHKIDIQGSPYLTSMTWPMWDMSKQFYYWLELDKSDNTTKYTKGDPLVDKEKTEEIVNRHVGWEAYESYKKKERLFVNFVMGLPMDVRKQIQALLNKKSKENGTLSSYDLAILGEFLRECSKLPLVPSAYN